MKLLKFVAVIAVFGITIACTKNEKYVCKCTLLDSGSVHYGDTININNKAEKKLYEDACLQVNDLSQDEQCVFEKID